MSDQGSVNPLFNTQLKCLREKRLPNAIENRDGLPETQRKDMTGHGKLFLQVTSVSKLCYRKC